MKRGLLLIGYIIFGFSALFNYAYAGFGITPPYVHNETLRPGSEFTQEIIIVRSDPVEDLDAELTLNLPGIESWFSFDRGLKFSLPKGESQVKMNVTVRIPEDAKLGAYNGNIRIRTSSANVPTTGVSLALGAQIDVHLKIVEEIYNFEVRRVELFEAEQGFSKWWLDFPGKIKFALYIENTGNIPASPSEIKFDIYDSSGSRLLESVKNTNKIDRVLPFATKKVYAYFPTYLPPGGYRVKYVVQKDEEMFAQMGELALSVLPRGTITGYEGYGFEGLSVTDKLSVIIPGFLLVAIFFIFAFMRRRTPRRPVKKIKRVVQEEDDDDIEPEPEIVERPRPRRASSGVVDLSKRR